MWLVRVSSVIQRCRSLLVLVLVLSTMSSIHSASAQETENTNAQQLEQILKSLDLLEAIDLVDSTAEMIARNTTGYDRLSETQRLSLMRQLKTAAGSDSLRKQLVGELAQLAPALIASVGAQLESPIVQRANNFDTALEMPGAYDKFDRYRQTKAKDEPEVRRELARQLTTLKGQARIAALLQTQLSLMAQQLIAQLLEQPEPAAADVLAPKQQQARETYLTELAADLHLYSYLYMKTDELEQYVAVFASPEIQDFLTQAQQSLAQSLSNARSQLAD